MPDGYASSYLPALSRLMGEVEQPTNTQGMMNPQFGGTPEQLQGIFQHPQTQALMQQLGIHFDPNQIRQSPFFPQSFMQHHPMLGGMLNRGMANVAATPEAPLVSGAGSGMTRAMQGMMGGPELLRQYQVRQMLAPMQAAGGMIPGQEFQRKQQLLTLLQKMEEDRQRTAQAGLAEKATTDLAKTQAGREKLEMTHDYFPPGNTGVYQPFIPGAPAGWGLVPGGGPFDFSRQPETTPHYGPVTPLDPAIRKQWAEAGETSALKKQREARGQPRGTGSKGEMTDKNLADELEGITNKYRPYYTDLKTWNAYTPEQQQQIKQMEANEKQMIQDSYEQGRRGQGQYQPHYQYNVPPIPPAPQGFWDKFRGKPQQPGAPGSTAQPGSSPPPPDDPAHQQILKDNPNAYEYRQGPQGMGYYPKQQALPPPAPAPVQ